MTDLNAWLSQHRYLLHVAPSAEAWERLQAHWRAAPEGLAAELWREQAAHALEAWPDALRVLDVELLDAGGAGVELARTFEVDELLTAEELAEVLASPHLPSQLTRLALADMELRDGELEPLLELIGRRLPALASLQLRNLPLSVEGLARIFKALPSPPTLRSLDLSDLPLGLEGVELLAAAPQLARVERLLLYGCELEPGDLEVLAASPHLGQLTYLHLGFNNIGAEGAAALAALPALPRLHTLALSGANIEGEGLAALLPRLGALERLELNDNSLDPSALRALLASPVAAQLRVLQLAHNPLGPKLHPLPALGRACPHLHTLDLDGCGIGDSGVAALVQAGLPASLRSLSLHNNRIGLKGCEPLSQHAPLTHLRSLNLTHNSLFADEPTALDASPFLTRLQRPQRLYGGAADAAERALEALRDAVARGVALDLSGDASVGAAGVRALLRAPEAAQLTALHIPAHSLGDDGLYDLLDHLPPRLHTLHLSGNGFSAEGAAALAASPLIHRLHALELHDTDPHPFPNGDGPLVPLCPTQPRHHIWTHRDHAQALAVDVLAAALASPSGLLDLTPAPIGPHGLRYLLDCADLAQVRGLHVARNALRPDDLRALLTHPHLTGLTHLDLSDTPLTRDLVEALPRSLPAWGQLTSLNLSHLPLDPPPAPLPPDLHTLNLCDCYLGPEGLRALLPLLPLRLHTLNLRYNYLTPEAIAALAASPRLASLHTLDLTYNDLAYSGALALAVSPHLKRIQSLLLSPTTLRPEGLATLLNAPSLVRVGEEEWRGREARQDEATSAPSAGGA